jgi:hypothetical protein
MTMSESRDKPTAGELAERMRHGACATTREHVADRLAKAERCPVVLSRGQRDVIRKALRNMAVGPSQGQSGVTHAERVAAREMIDREFKGELYMGFIIGLLLVAAGAVMRFALTVSPHWVNVSTVGAILLVIGAIVVGVSAIHYLISLYYIDKRLDQHDKHQRGISDNITRPY